MSYNGSRFDNHFILRALRNHNPKCWHNEINFIGTLNDLKILSY